MVFWIFSFLEKYYLACHRICHLKMARTSRIRECEKFRSWKLFYDIAILLTIRQAAISRWGHTGRGVISIICFLFVCYKIKMFRWELHMHKISISCTRRLRHFIISCTRKFIIFFYVCDSVIYFEMQLSMTSLLSDHWDVLLFRRLRVRLESAYRLSTLSTASKIH